MGSINFDDALAEIEEIRAYLQQSPTALMHGEGNVEIMKRSSPLMQSLRYLDMYRCALLERQMDCSIPEEEADAWNWELVRDSVTRAYPLHWKDSQIWFNALSPLFVSVETMIVSGVKNKRLRFKDVWDHCLPLVETNKACYTIIKALAKLRNIKDVPVLEFVQIQGFASFLRFREKLPEHTLAEIFSADQSDLEVYYNWLGDANKGLYETPETAEIKAELFYEYMTEETRAKVKPPLSIGRGDYTPRLYNRHSFKQVKQLYNTVTADGAGRVTADDAGNARLNVGPLGTDRWKEFEFQDIPERLLEMYKLYNPTRHIWDVINFVDNPDELKRYIRECQKPGLISVDAEWRPRRASSASLLQLAYFVGGNTEEDAASEFDVENMVVLLIDLLMLRQYDHSEWVPELVAFLSGSVLCGVDFIRSDMQMLKNNGIVLDDVSYLELSKLVKAYDDLHGSSPPFNKNAGLEKCFNYVTMDALGMPAGLSKSIAFSNWDRRPLPNREAWYAASDVLVVLLIVQHLDHKVRSRGSLHQLTKLLNCQPDRVHSGRLPLSETSRTKETNLTANVTGTSVQETMDRESPTSPLGASLTPKSLAPSPDIAAAVDESTVTRRPRHNKNAPFEDDHTWQNYLSERERFSSTGPSPADNHVAAVQKRATIKLATTHLAVAGYLRLCGLNCYHMSVDNPLPPDIEERTLITVVAKGNGDNVKRSPVVVGSVNANGVQDEQGVVASQVRAEESTVSERSVSTSGVISKADLVAACKGVDKEPTVEVSVKIGGAEKVIDVKAEWVIKSSGSPVEDTRELLRVMEIDVYPVFFLDTDLCSVSCCPLCGRSSLSVWTSDRSVAPGRTLFCVVCPCVVSVDHLGYLRWRFSKK